jgi:hypothetical protein
MIMRNQNGNKKWQLLLTPEAKDEPGVSMVY